MRAFDAATGQPWLIREDSLRTILEISSRENLITPEVIDKLDARREALATRDGRRMDATRYTQRRENGVAVIDISGPIVRYADMFSEISGATSTQQLARDIQIASDDTGTREIVLMIDSPGGEAAGIHELGEQIFALRGKKPVTAYVGGMGASAAYWIASAADEIVVDRTAMLGSIGVVFAVPDPTKRNAREIEIVSTQSPKKRMDVTTESGRSEIQRLADELADVFVESVARNRGVSVDTVLSKFGEGGMRIGADAVENGMADDLGSLESLIQQLGRPRVAAVRTTRTIGGNMADTKKTAEETTPVPEAKENPELIAALATIEDLKKKTAAAEALAAAAQKNAATAEQKTAETAWTAQVETWQREGYLSGNATAAVLAYGKTLDAAQREDFGKVIAALPKINGERVAADAIKRNPQTDVSAEDFTKAVSDVAAARRITAAVRERKKTEPKFTRDDLYRELTANAN